MSDVEYRIVVNLDQKGNWDSALPSASKLANIDSSFSKIGAGITSVAGSVADLFASAAEKVASMALSVGKLGAGLAIAGAAFGIKFNDELEQVKIGLASTLTAFQITPDMDAGLRTANELTNKMLQDVKTMPITFREFASMLKNMSAPVFMAGGTPQQLEEFTKKTAMFGAISGISTERSAQSMAQILTGRITNANPIVRQLGLGPEAGKLRDMNAEGRFEEINKRLDRYSGANIAFASSYRALFTTLKDNVMLFLGRETTAPLFETIKRDLATIGTWFVDNQDKISEWGTKIGISLENAWTVTKDKALEWGPILLSFAEKTRDALVAGFHEAEPIVDKISSFVKAMGPETFKHLAEAYGASKAVSLGTSSGGIAVFEKLAEVTGGNVEAFLALALAVTAVIGAYELLTDETSVIYDDVTRMWADAGQQFNIGMANLNDAWDQAKPMVDSFKTLMGTELIGSIELIAHLFSELSYITDILVSALSHAATAINSAFGFMYKTPEEKINREFEPHMGAYITGTATAVTDYMAKKSQLKELNGGGGTHINKVVIEVNQAGDPSRVARAVMDKLVDLKRYPKSSPFVPNYSAANIRR